MKVAVVEKDPFLGGTCLHRGCIPTKSLLENADVWGKIQKAKDFGITVGDVTINFSEVQKRKQGVVDANAKGIEFLFKKNKVDRVLGHGRVVKAGVVEVEGEGGKKTLNTKNIILAMGSVPRDLPHIKADGEKIINSDHILSIDRIPKSMLVIGAGAVGCEFASIFSRFGTKTTIVEVMPQLLPIEDDEISKEFTRIMKKKGIDVLVDAKVLSCEPTADGVKSVVEAKGKQQTIETELVLSATGRGPVTGSCGLEKLKGVKLDKRGYIEIDQFMRTGEQGVYAIGDIVPTPALAHCASAEGILAVEHLAGKDVRPINYDHVPNATYTEPEVASVGLTEKKAKERGYDVKTGKFPMTANSKAKILGEANGLVKYVVDAKYDEI